MGENDEAGRQCPLRYRYGPKAAKAAFGFDAAYPIEQLDKKLAEFLVDRDTLWHAIGHDAAWDARIAKALNEVRAQTRAGKRAPRAIHDLRAELDAYYAHLYGLTRDELRYILDPADVKGPDYPSETFRVLKNNEMREFGEYRTQRLVLAAWDAWGQK